MLEGSAYKVDQTNSTASTSSGTTKEDFGSATWRRGRSVRRDDDVSCKEPMVGRSLDSGRRTRSASQVPLSRRRYSTSEVCVTKIENSVAHCDFLRLNITIPLRPKYI